MPWWALVLVGWAVAATAISAMLAATAAKARKRERPMPERDHGAVFEEEWRRSEATRRLRADGTVSGSEQPGTAAGA